jgi:hypothetical protein
LGGVGGAPAAGGDELLVDLAGDGQGFVHTTDQPWLDVDDLAPGSVRTRDLVVWNRTDRPADLRLLVTDLVDEENGCLRPEARVPGEECGADGGELSSWLTVELVQQDGTAVDASRTLAELADDPAGASPIAIGPGQRLPLALRLVFLPESVNDTMTDRVGFDLRLDATMAAATPVVLGEEETVGGNSVAGPRIEAAGIGGDGAVLGRPVHLPLTGSTLPLWVVLLDLLVLVGGGSLVVVGRRT